MIIYLGDEHISAFYKPFIQISKSDCMKSQDAYKKYVK